MEIDMSLLPQDAQHGTIGRAATSDPFADL
jgi:hypothetical protein